MWAASANTIFRHADDVYVSGMRISANGLTLKKGVDEAHIKIPEGIKFIENNAFGGFTKITSVQFPNSLWKIGKGAFFGCSRLTLVDFCATNLTTIGVGAFNGCTGLTLVIPSISFTNIGDHAFFGCTGLTSVVFPSTLTSIGESAFQYCIRLTSVDLSATNLTSIGEWTFNGCMRLTSVKLPSLLTEIREGTFCDCRRLSRVELPNSLTVIRELAFKNCRQLKVIVPLSSVARNSFEGCRLVVNVSGRNIPGSDDPNLRIVDFNPRIIGLRQRLFDMWSQNIVRQGRMRQTSKNARIALSTNMMGYETMQSNIEKSEVRKVWRQIKDVLLEETRKVGRDRVRAVVKFLFAKIMKGGRRLVTMKSYLNQPEETKVFKTVFEDFGILEEVTESSGEEKEVHVAKRMKRLRF